MEINPLFYNGKRIIVNWMYMALWFKVELGINFNDENVLSSSKHSIIRSILAMVNSINLTLCPKVEGVEDSLSHEGGLELKIFSTIPSCSPSFSKCMASTTSSSISMFESKLKRQDYASSIFKTSSKALFKISSKYGTWSKASSKSKG